jgi:hypothetical protein
MKTLNLDVIECANCGKTPKIISRPTRSLVSPEKPGHAVMYCSERCKNQNDLERYVFYAQIDRNASDSECFVHDGWNGKMRVGHCKITNEKYEVEPLMSGENSGQPKSCYQHFVIHPRYKIALEKYAKN